MIVATTPRFDLLRDAVAGEGYVFVRGAAMRPLLMDANPLTDLAAFIDSWNDLPVDTYMADGGRYRRRRHATYAASADAIVRQPHSPHYQSPEYNRLNGGVARWFAPIDSEIGEGPTMTAVLRFCRGLFGELAPYAARWTIEAHQFRIEARTDEPGQPTPEGIHRDGVDYVLVLLVGRHNITEGRTTVYADQRPLGSFTLTDPFDAALVDDHRVAHGVTAVEAIDPSTAAFRDVLVVTFRCRL